MGKYAEFLAGERHDDVAVFLHADATTDLGPLADHGETVADGVVIVVPGDRGREVFQSVAGLDPMALASEARDTDGEVADSLTDGTCPDAGDGDAHVPRLIFAFSEAENQDVDGLYAEGDVMHAYVSCTCGTTYGDRWLIDGDD